MSQTTNAFEDRLLDALLDRFDTLGNQPTAVPMRSPRRVNIRRYAVPVGCPAAAVTVASVILEMGGSAPASHPKTATPSYALAAWTTHPTPASPAQISTAENLCAAAFDQPGATQPASGQRWQPPPGAGGPWTPVLVDTRGDLTLALYSDGTNTMACLAGRLFVSLNSIDTTGEPPVAANTASLDRVSTRDASGDPYTFAVGRIGSGVTAVGLQRVDGTIVTAQPATVASSLGGLKAKASRRCRSPLAPGRRTTRSTPALLSRARSRPTRPCIACRLSPATRPANNCEEGRTDA